MNRNPNKDVYVLGIHDGHTAGAAIIRNGEVIVAISEERLTNVKNQSGLPVLAIAKVFEIAGVDPSVISLIAVASYIRVTPDPQKINESLTYRIHVRLARYLHSPMFTKMMISVLKRLNPRTDIYDIVKAIGLESVPIKFIEHHTCHAACAYYSRLWNEKALILTMDGMGDGVSATISIGTDNTMQRISSTGFYDSIGNSLYGEMTVFMGLKKCEHEYKIMGLAPYGDYRVTADVFRNIIRINPKRKLEFENISGSYMDLLQPVYRKLLAKKRFDHIAAGIQKVYEELVVGWVRNAIAETGIRNIVCAGGSFLNVKANKLIRELPEVKKCFFYPSADDGGMAVGAALEGYVQYCNQHKIKAVRVPISDIYYGQSFTEEEIRDAIRKSRISRHKISHVQAGDVAKMLTQGKIIARFAGRDEWGPRSLGNRSIMADPRDLRVVGRINDSIKQRDFWMPFAPSILEEDQKRYLVDSKFSPYMIEAFDTHEEGKRLIAALHPKDFTARPQTVNDWNPEWQKIIRAFKKETGVGGILNTSFNLHGYPLVSSPDQALWTFKNSKLDGLLFNTILISR